MTKPRFSIIVPMYNCAPFLNEALEGISFQKYDNYEIILVDDGSKDETGFIAVAYAEKHDNTKYIRINHGGAGAARNAGIKSANGEYVLFLDADDYWTDPLLLVKLDKKVKKYQPHIIMYQMIQVDQSGAVLNGTQKPKFPVYKELFYIEEVYISLVKDGQVLASACNKCVKKELLEDNKILFLEKTTGEDIDWVLQLFSYAKTIVFINEKVYAYRQHHIGNRASSSADGPENLARIICHWSDEIKKKNISNPQAVGGIIAFEFGIYMGYSHLVSTETRKLMREYRNVLFYGLDRKTKLIARVYRFFGFNITCFAVRCYLSLRRFWR